MDSVLRNKCAQVAVMVAALVASAPMGASAQGFESNRFHPAGSARHDYITAASGTAALPAVWELGLWLQYASSPLVARLPDGSEVSVIDGQLVGHLVPNFAFGQYFRLSADIPFYLMQTSEDVSLAPTADIESGGIGDIRIIPKLSLLDGRYSDVGARETGAALAFLVPISLPTGDPDRLQGEGFRLEPTLAFDFQTATGWGVALNVGLLIREDTAFANVDVNEQLTYAVAAQAPLSLDVVHFLVELNGALTPGADGDEPNSSPMELLGLFRLLPGDFVIGLGGGIGLTDGYGAPAWRGLLQLAYSPVHREPEPEVDTDGDGYLDSVDGCPLEPEDFDTFQDSDGCPDPDNDADGILDADDECPMQPEDVDGFADADGCPDVDNDQDGILDADDQCPGRDGEVLADVQENYNAYEDTDGCPDVAPPPMEIVPTHIEIDGIVYFDYDSARIQTRSMPIIEGVAETLIAHPELTLVEVEGHTDVRGDDDYNLRLSQERVESVVDALVERGVARNRLRARGYGESRPVEQGETEAAHQANRRVEFRIVEGN